jgi:hypothetical protein
MKCPHCANTDATLIEAVCTAAWATVYWCGVCARMWTVKVAGQKEAVRG